MNIIDIQEQINRLTNNHGVIINNNDIPLLKRVLKNNIYPRLMYCVNLLPYNQRLFNNIYELYLTDKKLRMLIFDAIEEIEIALRSQIFNELSNACNSHHWWKSGNINQHCDKCNDISDIVYQIMNSANSDVLKTDNQLVVFNKNRNSQNYSGWIISEELSFGQVSIIYSHLKPNKLKVIGVTNSKHTNYSRAIKELKRLRNSIAHHSPIINYRCEKKFNINKNINGSTVNVNDDRLFFCVYWLNVLLKGIRNNSKFQNDFRNIINSSNYSLLDNLIGLSELKSLKII